MSEASMISVAVLAGLESALNSALALDPATRDKLAQLEGRVIAVEVTGVGLTLVLRPTKDGVRLMSRFDGEADTTLRGAPMALFRMSSGPTGEGLFSGDVTIDGDIELGQKVQRIFRQLDIDWEEHLSRLTGDIVAHQVGNTVRGLFDFGRRTLDTLGLDTADYLKYETETVPTREEMEQFLAQVDTIRTDVDRLEARIKRLHGKMQQIDID